MSQRDQLCCDYIVIIIDLSIMLRLYCKPTTEEKLLKMSIIIVGMSLDFQGDL